MDLPGRSCSHGNSSCVNCPDCQVDIRWGGLLEEDYSNDDELLENQDQNLQQGLLQDINTRKTTFTNVIPEDNIFQEKDEVSEIQAQNVQQGMGQNIDTTYTDGMLEDDIIQSEEEMPESQLQSEEEGTSFDDFMKYCISLEDEEPGSQDDNLQQEILKDISEASMDEVMTYYKSQVRDEMIARRKEMTEIQDGITVFLGSESDLNEQEILLNENAASIDGDIPGTCILDSGFVPFRSQDIYSQMEKEDIDEMMENDDEGRDKGYEGDEEEEMRAEGEEEEEMRDEGEEEERIRDEGEEEDEMRDEEEDEDEMSHERDERISEGDDESNEMSENQDQDMCFRCYVDVCDNIALELDLLKHLQIQKIEEVLNKNILDENSEEHLPESTTEAQSQVFLTEEYVEFPGRLFEEKPAELSLEEIKFFEYSKAVLLGKKSNFSPDDFSRVNPNIEISVSFFLKFICEENKNCTEPEILVKFITVIATILSIPKAAVNENQLKLLVKFLLHCLFINVHHVDHLRFRQTVAQMLSAFTNKPGIISRKIYKDIIDHFKKAILFFPLELYQWNAILVTVKVMGVSAIQSVIVPDFERIYELIEKSLKSLEPFKVIRVYANGDETSDNKNKEREKFNSAVKTYIDASNLYAQLLKLCVVLIEEVIKEDIRTDKRVIYVPEEINVLLKDHEHLDPEPITYNFDHKTLKPFFDQCFEYFGDALMPHILSVFTKYEKSNYSKAVFFKQKYKLIPVDNVYLMEENAHVLEKKREQENKKRLEELKSVFDKSDRRFDVHDKTSVLLNPLNRRLGLISNPEVETELNKELKIANKSQTDEFKHYLNCIKNIPQPWLNVLSEQYRAHHRTEPQHWRFTGNLETYI